MSSFAHFLAGKKTAKVGAVELRLISAYELLQAQREAEDFHGQEQTEGLLLNACILAKAAQKNGKPLFASGEEVLRSLSAQTIEKWMLAYVNACEQDDPSCLEDRQELKRQLEHNAYERLKWRVLKAFSVLPSERRAKEMTAGDYLYCVLNLMLDEEAELTRLCPSCRTLAEQNRCAACGELLPEQNAGFDEKRFEELKHGADPEKDPASSDGAGVGADGPGEAGD